MVCSFNNIKPQSIYTQIIRLTSPAPRNRNLLSDMRFLTTGRAAIRPATATDAVPWISSLNVQYLSRYLSKNRKALWFPKSSNWNQQYISVCTQYLMKLNNEEVNINIYEICIFNIVILFVLSSAVHILKLERYIFNIPRDGLLTLRSKLWSNVRIQIQFYSKFRWLRCLL